MIGLSGSLQAVGFRDLVGFLAGLGKSGTLRISHDRWAGEVVFDRGEVVGAKLGSERGLAALDAIGLALPDGEFAFADATPGTVPPEAHNVDLPAKSLLAHLDELLGQRAGDAVLTPATVPFVAQGAAGSAAPAVPGGVGRVALTRGAIQTLLAVDGRRSVAEIAVGRGLAETIKDLQALVRQGLVGVPQGTPVIPGVAATQGAPATEAPPATEAAVAQAVAPVAPVVPAIRAVPVPAPPSAPPPPPAPPPAAPGTRAGPTRSAGRLAEPIGTACPLLGFADDPANHFPRPTQLHRCFAGREPQRIAAGD